MNIQKKPTLAEKQAFWTEQLPNFEATYWLPSHFEFLAFDMDQGNYVINDDLSPDFECDATEIWHRVNTGWAMWKKAINFSRKQAQAVPEGFVLVETSELESIKSDNEHFTKSCIDWTERAYKQRAKVEHIKNEVERFKQSGTSLDLGFFLDNLIEFSTFKHDAEFDGFVLVLKDQFEHLNEFKDLYKRAITNAKKRKGQLNWAHVANLGVGSSRAIELCKTLNIDPSATNMHEVIKTQEQSHD